jgi:lysine-specific demethylase 8
VSSLRGLSKWTPDYLADALGDTSLSVLVSDSGFFPRNDQGKSINERTMTVSQFMEKYRAWTPESHEYHYVKTLPISALPPQLASDLDVAYYVPLRTAFTDIWWGTGGTRSALHYDIGHNISVQLAGRKEWTVGDPWQYDYCHAPFSKNHPEFSSIDIDNPDLRKHPMFRHAKLATFMLEEGDVLYLPSWWWHRVVAFEPSISLRHIYKVTPRDWFVPAIGRNVTRRGVLRYCLRNTSWGRVAS